MTTDDDFERRWRDGAPSPVGSGTVRLVVVRTGDEHHVMPPLIEVSPERGIAGDRWARAPHPDAQISLIDRRTVDVLVAGDPARWHVPGDNLVVDLELAVDALPVGARLAAGSAILEITAKPHAGCNKFRARLGDDALRWVNAPERRPRRLRGVYARIVEAGTIGVGDGVRILRLHTT